MKRDDRDIVAQQDYTPLSNAELVAHIEEYARLMHNTPLSDGEWLDDIIGPANMLLARAEAAEAERDDLRDAQNVLSEALEAARQKLVELTARVAKLEAQLAAQGWRAVTEKPRITAQYQVALQHGNRRLTADHRAYYEDTGWVGPDVIFWRPIPPLPPAPDTQEATTP